MHVSASSFVDSDLTAFNFFVINVLVMRVRNDLKLAEDASRPRLGRSLVAQTCDHGSSEILR